MRVGLADLTRLNISACNLHADAVQALAPLAGSLQELVANHNFVIGDDGSVVFTP